MASTPKGRAESAAGQVPITLPRKLMTHTRRLLYDLWETPTWGKYMRDDRTTRHPSLLNTARDAARELGSRHALGIRHQYRLRGRRGGRQPAKQKPMYSHDHMFDTVGMKTTTGFKITDNLPQGWSACTRAEEDGTLPTIPFGSSRIRNSTWGGVRGCVLDRGRLHKFCQMIL